MNKKFGIALSGGGSRAMAFHLGVLKALNKNNLIDRVDLVSTVSGGSVFGAAWLSSINNKQKTDDFINNMSIEISKGFILRAIFQCKVLLLLTPFFNRTMLLSDLFEKIFKFPKSIHEFPEKPMLCVNTTIMNNAQNGRFTKDGFSAKDVSMLNENNSYNNIKILDFSLGKIVASSAAFPIGLPPIKIHKKNLNIKFFGERIKEHNYLYLTDGGVLENYGIQTLLKSKNYKADIILASDAGIEEKIWNPNKIIEIIKNIFVSIFSINILSRIILIMNDKQHRNARRLFWLETHEEKIKSSLQFIRLSSNWDKFISEIPKEIDIKKIKESENYEKAKKLYLEFEQENGFEICNNVSTSFTKINNKTLDLLSKHAEWQTYLALEILNLK